MSKMLVYLIPILLTTSPSIAQQFPALLVFNPTQKKSVPLELTKLAINVQVTGNLATTTMDLTFFNPNNRQLEGQFYFPLGRGQTVSRFALDVGGHLREGVVVEKNRGQQIFEDVERRNIDPGLLEWVKGNNFKARIFPIPANGYKRLVIAYEQELSETPHGYLYLLPLQFQKRVEQFSIHVEVFKQQVAPRLTRNELTNLSFEKWNESYIADFQARQFLPNKQIGFTVPRDKRKQKSFVFRDSLSQKQFFYTHFIPDNPRKKRRLPHRVTLLWDASASGDNRDIDKELTVLDGYFSAIKNATIQLVTFSNTILEEKSFTLKNGHWEGLKEYLKKIDYDGGTQLGVLDLNRYSCDEFILCSDGLSNFGEAEMKLGHTPVVVINSSPNANHAYLQFIADSSKGRYVDLTTLPTQQAVDLLLHKPLFFMGAVREEGEVTELYPSIPVEVQHDFSLTGQLVSSRAKLRLQFGDGQKVTFSKRVIINASRDSVPDPIVRRTWAKKKLAQLTVHMNKNKERIIQLAKDYRIVTPFTSLLVLDRLEDYLRYHIVPPEKKLKEQYFARLQEQKKEKEQEEKEHLEYVAQLFQERIAWWNKKFPTEKPVVKKPSPSDTAEHDSGAILDSLISWSSEAFDNLHRAHPSASQPSRAQREHEVRRLFPDVGVFDLPSESVEGGNENYAMYESPLTSEYREEQSSKRSAASRSIKVQKWDPDTPYLKALKKTEPANWYQTYLCFRKGYSNSPAFYFDVADYFYEKGETALSLRILSNIAELELENHELLRLLGYRLLQRQAYRLAEHVFREVLRIRPEEPQSYRDLALTLAAEGKYQEAIELLWQIVCKKWDDRFPEIELIALNEMNNIIATCEQSLDLSAIDKRFLKNLPVDIRVVLSWDADNTDIDLWVIDPYNEKCYYKNRDTHIGGHLSRDFAGGYGPEEFLLHRAVPGEYFIKAHYYGNYRPLLSGNVTIFVEIFTHYGTPRQRRKSLTFRLENIKDVFDIGSIKF